MNFLKFFLIFFHLVLFSSTSFANANVAFIDVDLILSESEPSKKLFSQLKIIEDKRINELKNNEINLIEEEKKISKTKNIISKEEFDKRVNTFKNKVENYQKSKKKLIEDIKQTRNAEIIRFFKLINPIIEKIMDENSIEILIEKKNIFMAKSDNDITKIIIEKINKDIKEYLIEEK